MIAVTVRVEGTDRVLRMLRTDIPRAMLEAAYDVVEAEANVVLDRGKELVPTLLFKLQQSGRVEYLPSTERGVVEFDVVFGNEEVYYAWIIHEDLEMYHDDGQAKYLETAGLELQSTGPQRIAEGFRSRLR